MQINQNYLLQELSMLAQHAITTAKKFSELTFDELNYKLSPDTWSILECLEHLNLYGDFYLPEIEKSLLKNKNTGTTLIFKPGLIGNYFAKLMQVKNGKIKKMKSPADKNPVNSELTVTTIDRFIKQTQKLLSLLDQAKTADLSKLKTPISLSKFIKLRLGDTFRFYVYHIDRHILQAMKIKTPAHLHIETTERSGMALTGPL